jgi:uncharacterized membrane protein
MNDTVKCPQCGNENPISRLFCKHCGAKLDLSQVRTGRSIGHIVSGMLSRLIRFVVLVALLTVLGLLLWPTKPVGQAGTEGDSTRLRAKLTSLHEAISINRFLAGEITEEEVNAYLAALLKHTGERQPEGAPARRLTTQSIVISVAPESMVVHILAGWGPLALSYEVVGSPVLTDAGFGLVVATTRLGHLPMPGASRAWLAARLSGVFANLSEERHILDHLALIELKEQKVRVETRVR